jgi:hypothetical protein
MDRIYNLTTTLKLIMQIDIENKTCIICWKLQMHLIKAPTKTIQSNQPWPEHKNHYNQYEYVSCANIHFHIGSMTIRTYQKL